MKKNAVTDLIKPVVVLTIICLVAAAALGLVNAATEPIITERKAAAALAQRQAFFPDAAAFTEVSCDLEGVVSVFAADCGGYVITVDSGGYNGNVPVTVGVDADGVVVAASADTSGETANKGTVASEPEYLSRFVGLTGNADGVDTIAGATISTRAVRNGVTLALKAYEAVKEG